MKVLKYFSQQKDFAGDFGGVSLCTGSSEAIKHHSEFFGRIDSTMSGSYIT